MTIKAGSYMVLHADLFVRFMKAALDFYCSGLGFSVVEDALIHGPLVHSISAGRYDSARLVLIRVSRTGAMIELLEFQPESALRPDSIDAPLPTGWVSILIADELERHIDAARSRGLHPVSETFEMNLPRQGPCRVVFYQDLDGNRLEFIQLLPSAR